MSQVQKSVIQKIQRAYGLLLQETLVQDVFEKEIAQQSVSLEISSLPELQIKSPKRVLDKVRSQWQYEKDCSRAFRSPFWARVSGTANPGGQREQQ